MEYKKRESHRRMAKDTSKKASEIYQKIKIDEFTIIAREYEASENESSLSPERSYKEYDEGMEYDKAVQIEQNKRKRTAYPDQADFSDFLNHPQDIMASRARYLPSKQLYNDSQYEQERLEYNAAKMYKKIDESDARTQGFSIEDNQSNVTKIGPFETNKVPNSRNQDLNDPMSIEKQEVDQIYTPQRLNSLLGLQSSPYMDNFNSRVSGQNNQMLADRDFPMTRAASNPFNGLNSDCMQAIRQKHLLPSAQRILTDMEATEKKFYERFLSTGYKLCE